jgi:APA family basic amino acid/polyamine antiporter
MHEAAEEEAEQNDAGGQDDGQGGITPAQKGGMAKVLTVWDVIAYGVGSTLGAGIFAITAPGALAAGPAVVLSFCVAAISCLFSAFSYMEFAARVPIAGSAYTFSYVCLGELAAWFVGWNLTLEYAISAAVVARTWSSNLELFIQQIGGNYPTWLSDTMVDWGIITDLSPMSAVICLICMGVLLLGVKESSNMNIFITVLNICVISFICIYGSFYVHTENWTSPDQGIETNPHTYFPKGLNGVLTGAATVFFSYIGFDAVTTLSEEVKNPKRDVPLGIIVTLILSTLMYVATTMVITGMQPWWSFVDDTGAPNGAPLAFAFKASGVSWAATLIAAATVTALTGSTLTSLFGQPRIFYRMAKDGLLFKVNSAWRI